MVLLLRYVAYHCKFPTFPQVFAIKNQVRLYPSYYYQCIGLEISGDWCAARSRIAVDEGIKKMYVVVPVKDRANAIRKEIADNIFG
jgi:hypothetical protein